MLGDQLSGGFALMRAIAKLDNHYTGEILINGKNIKQQNIKNLNIAYLPNEPVFSEHVICTWHLPFQIDLTGELHYRSKTYCDRANKESVDSETLLHASVSKTFKTKTRFTFAVNNITDEDHQNIYDSYPKPGREYKATIIQDF